MGAWEIATNIFAGIAALGIGVSAIAAAAFALFRLFGAKWLDAKFNERLENYKHLQQRELEKLKFNINALMDRTTKLHQHEFDVLPQVWSRLTKSFGEVQIFTSPLQQHANLDMMEDAQLEEFLNKSELLDWQKAQLKQGQDRNSRYFKMKFWHDYNRVYASYASFHNYFIQNGIFIQPELKKKLVALSDALNDALHERSFEEQYPNPRADRFAKCEYLRKSGGDLLKAIENEVQSRLWEARALED